MFLSLSKCIEAEIKGETVIKLGFVMLGLICLDLFLSHLEHLHLPHTSCSDKLLQHTADPAPTHLFVCLLMQFCTFLFEQNGRGHSDPGVTRPAPHS